MMPCFHIGLLFVLNSSLFKKYNFIFFYLIFGCAGSLLLRGLLSVAVLRLLSAVASLVEEPQL